MQVERRMNASPLNNFKSSTLKVLHSQWSDDLELSWGAWRGDHSGPPRQSWWPRRPRPGARSRSPAQSRSPEPPGICWHTWTWHLPLKPSNRQSSYRASKYVFIEFSTNVGYIYSVLPGDAGGGQGAVCAARQVEAITRRYGDRGRADVRTRGDRWGGRHW